MIEDLSHRQLVKSLVRKGCTQEEIFAELSPESKLNAEQITQLFQNFYKDPTSNSLHKHYPLLYLIGEEFQKLRFQIASWPNSYKKRDMQLLDDRYSVLRVSKDSKIVALNVQIPIPESDIADQNYVTAVHMEVVNLQYIIFHELHYYRRKTRIFLVELDILNGSCKIVDKQKIDGEYMTFIFDPRNKHNFAMRYGNHASSYVQKGRIENSKFVFDSISFNSGDINVNRFSSLQLNNDKMYGFGPRSTENEDEKAAFYEITLNAEKKLIEPKKLFSVKEEHGLNINKCMWHGQTISDNVWYFTDHTDITGNCTVAFQICKFDMQTGCLTKLDTFGLNRVNSIHVNSENSIITVCTEGTVESTTDILRFPLGRPDTLSNLTLLSLSQKVHNNGGEDKFNKLMEKLPANLRPPLGYLKAID
ncbi:hypothetical protein M3Y97_00929100 [Aphelenchoides bicaudatus]|nr:hypothetical protein M3Y97_00929100 [Aphelenchoides bicaudatus]